MTVLQIVEVRFLNGAALKRCTQCLRRLKADQSLCNSVSSPLILFEDDLILETAEGLEPWLDLPIWTILGNGLVALQLYLDMEKKII